MRDLKKVTGMHSRHGLVTIEQAKVWLARLYPKQRILRASTVETYADQMRRGTWCETPEGISIGEDGTLLNGQHRLHALIRVGYAMEMYVHFGVPLSAYHTFDAGVGRSLADRIAREGVDGMVTAIARSVALGRTQQHTSFRWVHDAEVMASFIERLSSGIDWVLERRPKGNSKRYFPSVVCAVLVRAYYSTGDLSRLADAASYLRDGMPPSGIPFGADDRAIIALREWMNRAVPSSGSGRRAELYGKAERAVRGFLDREPLANLYAARDELFELPAGLLPIESTPGKAESAR